MISSTLHTFIGFCRAALEYYMIQDFSDDAVYTAWIKRYSRSIDKKYYARGPKIYLLKKRTSNTAMEVVNRLRKIPKESIALRLKVYHDGEEAFPNLVHDYELELLEAKENPEGFAKNLFAFYQKTAKKLKAHNEIELFFGLFAFVEDHTIADQRGEDFAINATLMDLLSQQTEFLRQDPYDYMKIVAGIRTDGTTTLEIDDPYPAIDLPICQLTKLLQDKQPISASSFLEREFKKLGFPGVRSLDDYEILNERSRMFIANVTCMAGFVNEYTFDMLPKQPLAISRYAISAPRLKERISRRTVEESGVVLVSLAITPEEYLKRLLRHRNQTLPANGVILRFDNSSLYLSLKLKETFKFDDLYLLYCLSTVDGDITGRYNVRTESFVSPLNSSVPRPTSFIRAINGLVMWAYSAVSCRDGLVQPTNKSYHLLFDDDNAHIEFVSLVGKAQRNDGPESKVIGERDLEKYDSKQVALNGYIRKLPKGKRASEGAKKLAEKLGFELAEDETFVKPFVRHTWILRQDNGGEDKA